MLEAEGRTKDGAGSDVLEGIIVGGDRGEDGGTEGLR